jgi:hypothetical protein
MTRTTASASPPKTEVRWKEPEPGRHPLDRRRGERQGEIARVLDLGMTRPEGPGAQAMQVFRGR